MTGKLIAAFWLIAASGRGRVRRDPRRDRRTPPKSSSQKQHAEHRQDLSLGRQGRRRALRRPGAAGIRRDERARCSTNSACPLRARTAPRHAEQIAAEKAAAKKAADEQQRAILAARRDQVLLDTYLSVDEIEALRDRRLELIDTQIKVTENYLQGLREILQKLQTGSRLVQALQHGSEGAADRREAREGTLQHDGLDHALREEPGGYEEPEGRRRRPVRQRHRPLQGAEGRRSRWNRPRYRCGRNRRRRARWR